MAKLKRCPKCGRNKRSSSFSEHKGYNDGLSYWCLECFAEYRKQKNEAALPFVYRLKFPDGSVYYGSSNQHPTQRKACHFSAMKRGKHENTNVQQKFDTYGLPAFEVLMELDSIKEAIENETHLTATAQDRDICCLNIRHGRNSNDQRKLTDDEVTEIYVSKLSQYELARRYGVSNVLVGRIKNRKRYKDVTANLGEPGRLTSRLTDEMKQQILSSTESGAALARRFGCTSTAINTFRRKNR